MAREKLFRGRPLVPRSVTLADDQSVVNLDDLAAQTLQIAPEIAGRPAIGLKLAKMDVNQTLDAARPMERASCRTEAAPLRTRLRETQFGYPVANEEHDSVEPTIAESAS